MGTGDRETEVTESDEIAEWVKAMTPGDLVP